MSDNEATVASVRQQVIGLERGHGELRQELHSVEQKMDRGFVAVDTKMDAGFVAVDTKMVAGFGSITSKLDEKTTPQWQAYGLIATVLLSIGGALFWPIREQAAKQDLQIEAIRAVLVPRVEHERFWKEEAERDRAIEERIRRLWETHNKTDHDLGYLEGQLHPISK